MLGALAVILIGIWYYKGGLAAGKNPVQLAIMGAVLFFLPAISWTYWVTPGLKDTASHTQNSMMVFFVQHAYVLVGVAVAALLYPKLTAKDEVDAE